MRVVTKPRVSESEKPVEKPKEEGEEVKTLVIVSHLVEGSKNSFGLILHYTFACSCICTTFSENHSFALSFSIQNNFQILPVENNWEKGVRKEFKPFSSEIIASQVSFVVATSFCLLLYPCVSLFV